MIWTSFHNNGKNKKLWCLDICISMILISVDSFVIVDQLLRQYHLARIIWTEHDHVRELKNLWSSIYFDFVASSLKFKFADRSIIIGSSFWLLGFFLLLVVNSHTSIIPHLRAPWGAFTAWVIKFSLTAISSHEIGHVVIWNFGILGDSKFFLQIASTVLQI